MGLEYKPDIVKIRGVHTDGQTEDIGFPNLGLADLFKNATVEEYNDNAFKSNLVYKDGEAYKSIEDESHFKCMNDGYTEFVGNTPDSWYVEYTKSGSGLYYHTSPSGDTWADKLALSNDLKAVGSNPHELTIESTDKSHIMIDDKYYLKNDNDNNYSVQTPAIYYLYDKLEVVWSDPYVSKYDKATNKETWTNSKGETAQSGYFVEVINKSESMYSVFSVKKVTFKDGQIENGEALTSYCSYRIKCEVADFESKYEDSSYIMASDGSKFYLLDAIKGKIVLTDQPDIYVKKQENWQYPNTTYPNDYNAISDSDLNKVTVNEDTFPVYTEATLTQLQTVIHERKTIYEQTGKVLHYKYGENSTIHIPLVSATDIDSILTSCNLPGDLKSYVHLTNLTYEDNSE